MSARLPAYAFDSLRLEPASRILLRDGQRIPLPPKAFDVLVRLVTSPGRLVTKEELLNEVWPDVAVEEGNLTVAISALRRALGDEPSAPRYIATMKGRGYQFVATVHPVAEAIVAGDDPPGDDLGRGL